MDRVDLAAVAGAHGVGGEVRLVLFTDCLENLKRHDLFRAGNRELRLISLRPGPRGAIARFEGVTSRDHAEALRGTRLSVDRESLPPLEPDEYYHSDLIGLLCVDRSSEPLGTVIGVENHGAGDLLEIERPDGRKALVPYRDGIADLVDGWIVVDEAFLA